MRQVTIDNLRRDLTKEIADLPFEVIKRGEVIAAVTSPNLKVQDNKPPNLKVQPPNLKVQPPNLKVQLRDHVITSGKHNDNGKFRTYFKK